MALTLALRNAVRIPVEVEGVLPESFCRLPPDAVRRFVVTQGNTRLTLDDLFAISGSCADDQTMIWQGDLHAVKRIGEGLTSGRVVVEGNAGMHLGAGMRGGAIEVFGNVTDWAGAEMTGGRIHIHGSAGDGVGGAYRGSLRGMAGGEILIEGRVGDELGRVMRRGLIAVAGGCGEFAGSRMIAGTILVGGQAGGRPGAGMKRGTIGLFGPGGGELLPGFELAGAADSLFLAPFRRRLHLAGLGELATAMEGRIQRWCGDRLTIGLGEILVRTAAG